MRDSPGGCGPSSGNDADGNGGVGGIGEGLFDDLQKAPGAGGGTVQDDVVTQQEFGQFAVPGGKLMPSRDIGGDLGGDFRRSLRLGLFLASSVFAVLNRSMPNTKL